MLSTRELQLINCVNNRKWISNNQTIIDYVVMHAEEKEMICKNIEVINHVRLHKKIILPLELVRFLGNKVTRETREVLERSSIAFKM